MGIVGGEWELGEIAPHLAGDVELSRNTDGWELTARSLEDAPDAGTVLAIARELLVLINAIARIHLDAPGAITLGNVRRYREGGTKDVFVFPEPARLKLRVGTPTILINGVAAPVPSWIPFLELAERDLNVQAVLAFLSGEPTWHGLYAALETIVNEPRTGGPEGLRRWAGISRRELSRFTRTANSYAALGAHARHGPGASAPSKPMSLTEANVVVGRIARNWLEELTRAGT